MSVQTAPSPPVKRLVKQLNLAFCSIVLLCTSCQKDPDDSLRGCCLNTAIDVDFGTGHLYIPNIFTPDGDGINDLLFLCGDSVTVINKLEIENRSGRIVFSVSNVSPDDPNAWWDGRVDGSIQKGVYQIHVSATASNGATTSVTKNVCTYPCENVPSDEYVNSILCQFGDQVNADCEFSGGIPSLQPFDCFK